MTKEQIMDKIMSYPKDMNLYLPNLSTWCQSPMRAVEAAMNELIQHGFAKRVKTLRYKGQVLSEYTVDDDKDFKWGDEDDGPKDPDDYMPIDKSDCEIVNCFRRL